MRASTISLKTEQDIEKLRISGRLAAEVLAMIGEHVKPGVTTEYLDDICNDFIVNKLHVIPAECGITVIPRLPAFHLMKWCVMAFHQQLPY